MRITKEEKLFLKRNKQQCLKLLEKRIDDCKTRAVMEDDKEKREKWRRYTKELMYWQTILKEIDKPREEKQFTGV